MTGKTSLGTDKETAVWLFFESDGLENEDWFGWRQPVLAGVSGVVERIHLNEVTNRPGVMTPGRATSVIIKRADGVRVLYAHLRELSVGEGDEVDAGQVIGLVGNNGFSRSPHIHIGAIVGEDPVGLAMDLRISTED